jgi:O-antigen/teichoic acid export membrane protein
MFNVGGGPVASTGALLARGSILRVLALAAGMAVGLFLMPFLIHALGDRRYGMWTLVVSITTYYTLLDFGMARAATRFLARAITLDDVTEANSVVSTALVILAGLAVVGLVAALGIAFGAKWFISDPLEINAFRHVLLILALDAAVALPALVANAVLLAHYRFDVLSCVQVAALLLRTALMVWVVLEGHSIVAMAVVVLVINLLSRAALAVAVRHLFPWIEVRPALLQRAQARQLFRYGRHALLAGCADRVRSTAGIFVVGFFLDMAAVTHYGIAARIAQLFAELMLQSLGVVGPLLMRADALGDREKTRRILLLTTRLSVVTSVTAAGAIILLGHRFIESWIGPGYRAAYFPLAILTASFAVWMMQWPSISVLYATARHQFYAYLSLGEAAANLVLSAVLVQSAGLIGASLGTALPLLISMLVLQPRYVCRILQLERSTYYRELGRAALLAILYQAPLFVGVYGIRLSSFILVFAIACAYYPSCLLVLLYQTLSRSERYQLGRAVPGLRWLAPWRRSTL